mmetsp:Transcript_22825/g.47976  ORF Transcript_22825/g.47976 Transcript_22825/m.47976 type:complete len:233 (-) Transcript_22825:150-848(-)
MLHAGHHACICRGFMVSSKSIDVRSGRRNSRQPPPFAQAPSRRGLQRLHFGADAAVDVWEGAAILGGGEGAGAAPAADSAHEEARDVAVHLLCLAADELLHHVERERRLPVCALHLDHIPVWEKVADAQACRDDLPHRGRHLLLDRRLLAQGARVGVGPRRQLGGADSGLAHQQRWLQGRERTERLLERAFAGEVCGRHVQAVVPLPLCEPALQPVALRVGAPPPPAAPLGR